MSLYCQNCGQESALYVDVCPNCGQRQHPLSGSNPVRAALPDRANEFYGVGGWLLIFCISLAVISPVTQGFIAVKAVRNLATARVHILTLLRLGLVGAIYGGLAVFSCFSGVMLWMKNPKAVSVARAYLLIAAVLPISLYLLLHYAGMHVDLLRIILRRLFYSVVWYSYLRSSRRVKVTYGKP
jgi:hypothetical protein